MLVLGSPHAKALGCWGPRLCICCCPAVRPQLRGFRLDILALWDMPGGCSFIESPPTMWAGNSVVLHWRPWCHQASCAKWHCTRLHASSGHSGWGRDQAPVTAIACWDHLQLPLLARCMQWSYEPPGAAAGPWSDSAWAFTSTASQQSASCTVLQAGMLPEGQCPPPHQAAVQGKGSLRPRVAADTNPAQTADPAPLLHNA